MAAQSELDSPARTGEGETTKTTVSLPPSDVTVNGFLGKGNFATVYRGTYRGKKVAIKAVPNLTSSRTESFAIQSFVHEAVLMQGCHHKNILEVYGTTLLDGTMFLRLKGYEAFVGTKAFAIIQELGSGNTLLQKVGTQMQTPGSRLYSEADALQWATDIARGLEHLHEARKMIIHRDLKLENVLLVKEGDTQVAKLADFGLSVMVVRGNRAVSATALTGVNDNILNLDEAVESWAQQNQPEPSEAPSFAKNAFVSLLASVQERKSLQRSRSQALAPDGPGPIRAPTPPPVRFPAAAVNGGSNSAPTGAEADSDSPSVVPPGARAYLTAELVCDEEQMLAARSALPPAVAAATAPLMGEDGSSARGQRASMQDVWALVREKHATRTSAGSERLSKSHSEKRSTLSKLKSFLTGRPSSTQLWTMTGQTGSFATMAPEVTRNEEYNEKVDIFAVGVMMWELFARTVLSSAYDSPGQLEAHAKRVAEAGYRPAMPNFFVPQLSDLINRCWAQDSRDRPSAKELIAELEKLKASGALEGMFPRSACCF